MRTIKIDARRALILTTSYGYDDEPDALYAPDLTSAVLDVLRRANRG